MHRTIHRKSRNKHSKHPIFKAFKKPLKKDRNPLKKLLKIIGKVGFFKGWILTESRSPSSWKLLGSNNERFLPHRAASKVVLRAFLRPF